MVASEMQGATVARAGGVRLAGVPVACLRLGGLHLGMLRRLGLVGALLMAAGSLGAGAAPAPAINPILGLRLLGLPARLPTVSLAVVYVGMALLVLAWLGIGRLVRRRGAEPLTRGQLVRILATWALPFAVAPPIFSGDVYTYLGQSATAARGLNPYLLGPAQALGVDDPITSSIPTVWRSTPAPYGPAFLGLGRWISQLAGPDVVLGVLLNRLVALAGITLIVVLLPRLATRAGVPAAAALWLGALNPLVLFHLVSGAHNEALMVGLMLAGIEVALSGCWGARSWLAGAALVALAAMIKIPALLGLGFLAVWLARRGRGRRALVNAAAGVGLVALTVVVAVSLGSGLGFGWTHTLDVPNLVRSNLSPSTDLGILASGFGIAAGLGDHTGTVLSMVRTAGLLVTAGICCVLLRAVFRGRLDLLAGLGIGLGAAVFFGPSVYSWYLLWAVVPLAAARCGPGWRRAAVAASVLMAFVLPPTGADFAFRAYQQPMAVAAAVVVVVVLVVLHGRLRSLPPWPPARLPASSEVPVAHTGRP